MDDLWEYETRINYVLPKYDDPVICTYDLPKFSAGVVMDIMRTHPAVIIGGVLQENPFFVPPDQFLLELRERRRSTSAMIASQSRVLRLAPFPPHFLPIADVQMPGMTGLELYQRLSTSGKPIPTILITAYPDDGVWERARSAGVIGYLSKPFDENDLLACIRSALTHARSGGR